MANAPQGLPSDYKNLSPFGSKKEAKQGGNTAFLAIGIVGILAAVALIFRALTLSA
mgnify:CR=1 FL=1|jgi:hypothetical protein|tara:strand:+ start:374 stop:541 length:168 start_codon:yes stop_codon:yes gene_type:complete